MISIEEAMREIEGLRKNPRTEDETDESWIQLNMLQGYQILICNAGEVPKVRVEFSNGKYTCKDRITGEIIDRDKAHYLLADQFLKFIGPA